MTNTITSNSRSCTVLIIQHITPFLKLCKMIKYKLPCKKEELQLLGTLNGGQSFRWNKVLKDGIERWIGIFNAKVWILEQNNDYILYEVHESTAIPTKVNETNQQFEEMLRKYFQLDLINLEEHYLKWSTCDPYFKEAAQTFYGVRILQQDPIENIFSFICSQNNHISRISSMVEKLATFYGSKICDIDGMPYYAFPEVEALANPEVEQKLRQNGFGYRAKYISKAAQEIVQQGGNEWFDKLKQMDYQDAKKKLITLTGIGPKVADCICLMSLGHLEAIPVDTHMYQIASRLYLRKLPKQKTITEKVYKEIGDHFRNLYGPLAGWAHTVLFCADLKKFKLTENGSTEESTTSKSKKRQKKC